jgi:hypothetical protein
MARENNFLIGNGKSLTKAVKVPSGGGAKGAPYTLKEARENLTNQLVEVQDYFTQLSENAKPKNQVVAKLTMHPRYIAKSDYPKDLFDSVGLRAVGSKSERISPEKWGIKKPPVSAITESYFLAGLECNFDKWFELLEYGSSSKTLDRIVTIEKISAILGQDKFKGIVDEDQHVFEIVLHNDHDPEIIELFVEYANSLGGEVKKNRIRTIDGLTFVPIIAESAKTVNQISDFSFVRAARGMPSLRPFNPMIRGVDFNQSSLILPSEQAIDTSIKTVIFDGGLANPSVLDKWVNYVEPNGIGRPTIDYLDHGLAVTGAYLFGHFNPKNPLSIPVSRVDHVRVLDENSGRFDYEIIDVLDRINKHLNLHKYDFVNISLGPDISVEDDDVTLWTASIDNIFSKGDCVATVAAGNNGERDAISGLNRIQVPSDAVNVIAVGATDSTGDDWKKASYSASGPGRCPGRAKPDLVVFGGSIKQPFELLSNNLSGLASTKNCGTSFAAPLTLRSIAGLRTILGKDVSHLSLRALMLHQAERQQHNLQEVGWGRAELEPLKLITSEDYEATVLFQGELLVGEHLRIPVPLQNIILSGEVSLKATLVISPEVDIEFPGAYTRHGVQAVFRPDDTKFKINPKTGKRSEHPASSPFFTKSDMFKKAEYVNRDEGNKWEPTLKHEESFKADDLSNPMFDVYYHYRESAQKASQQKPIPYSFIITVTARDIPDLYNQIIRSYATILTAYKPQNRIRLTS